jgi:hypothetical protein
MMIADLSRSAFISLPPIRGRHELFFSKENADMKSQTVLSCALVLFPLATLTKPATRPASASIEQVNVPTVTEALRSLEKALTRHGSYVSGGIIRRFDASDFRGCRITYELTPQVSPDHAGFVPFTERTTVNLSSLDIDQVKVRIGRRGALVGFATRDGASGIELRLGDGPHSFGEATELRSAYLHVTNRKAAEDVRGALQRAIKACVK